MRRAGPARRRASSMVAVTPSMSAFGSSSAAGMRAGVGACRTSSQPLERRTQPARSTTRKAAPTDSKPISPWAVPAREPCPCPPFPPRSAPGAARVKPLPPWGGPGPGPVPLPAVSASLRAGRGASAGFMPRAFACLCSTRLLPCHPHSSLRPPSGPATAHERPWEQYRIVAVHRKGEAARQGIDAPEYYNSPSRTRREDFQRERAGAGDHQRVVGGVGEPQAALAPERVRNAHHLIVVPPLLDQLA